MTTFPTKNDYKLTSLTQFTPMMKFANTIQCGHAFYERLSYQVKCCINCTNTNCTIHVYIVYSFAPDTVNTRLVQFPRSWCTNCSQKTL